MDKNIETEIKEFNILFVDDDEMITEIVNDILTDLKNTKYEDKNYDFSFNCETTIDSAIEKINKQSPYDLAILDINFNKSYKLNLNGEEKIIYSGIDLAKYLIDNHEEKKFKKPYLVAFTAYNYNKNKTNNLFDNYWEKPISNLYNKLNNLIIDLLNSKYSQ